MASATCGGSAYATATLYGTTTTAIPTVQVYTVTVAGDSSTSTTSEAAGQTTTVAADDSGSSTTVGDANSARKRGTFHLADPLSPRQQEVSVVSSTSYYTTTITYATETLYTTPAACSSTTAAAGTTSTTSAAAAVTTSTSASKSTETVQSALATVSDSEGHTSVVYLTYTETLSTAPVTVVTYATASATATTANTATNTTHHSTSVGAVVGGIVGGVAAIFVFALFSWWFLRRRRRNKDTTTLDELFQRSNGRMGAGYDGPSRGNSQATRAGDGDIDAFDEKGMVASETPSTSGDSPAATLPMHDAHFDNAESAAGMISGDRLLRERASMPISLAQQNLAASSSPNEPSTAATTPGESDGRSPLASVPPPINRTLSETSRMSFVGDMTSMQRRPQSPTQSPGTLNGTLPMYTPEWASAMNSYFGPSGPQYPEGSRSRPGSPIWTGPARPTSPNVDGRLPNPPISPGYHAGQMYQVPMDTNGRPLAQQRVRSSGSLNKLMNPPRSPQQKTPRLSHHQQQQQFGVYQSHGPDRGMASSPPPTGGQGHNGDWPPSRYGHLDIDRKTSTSSPPSQPQSPTMPMNTLGSPRRSNTLLSAMRPMSPVHLQTNSTSTVQPQSSSRSLNGDAQGNAQQPSGSNSYNAPYTSSPASTSTPATPLTDQSHDSSRFWLPKDALRLTTMSNGGGGSSNGATASSKSDIATPVQPTALHPSHGGVPMDNGDETMSIAQARGYLWGKEHLFVANDGGDLSDRDD